MKRGSVAYRRSRLVTLAAAALAAAALAAAIGIVPAGPAPAQAHASD